MTDDRLALAIMESVWARLQWDFLLQNPQLSDWLEGSRLEATGDSDVYRLVVLNPAPVDWLSSHTFAIRRGLSQEMGRPVEVRVVAKGLP